MRNFATLLKHELRMLLISPATYLAAFFFYLIMGLLYWSILRDMVATAQDELPVVYFFKLFWLPAFFVVPLLTMKSIAGQRSDGTLDALFAGNLTREHNPEQICRAPIVSIYYFGLEPYASP